MIRKQTITLLAICLVTLMIAPLALADNHTVDGVALLKVETGARPIGMGGAFVAVTGDARSSAYNPAGAAGITKFKASLGHTIYWENIRFETGWFAKSIAPDWTLHGGVQFAAVDDIQARQRPTDEPDALFDAHDVSIKTGLAYRITSNIDAGLSAGWILEKIEAFRGTAFVFDVGLVTRPKKNLTVAGSVVRIGGTSQLVLEAPGQGKSDEITLPTIYRLGSAYTFDRYLGALDMVWVDGKAHPHLGAEASLHRLLALRAGYMFAYDSKSFTTGVSFTQRLWTVDYAFVPYSNHLGSTHLFNLTLSL